MQTAPVTWRDGVHITGTPLWCDARRRRDVCFLSSADRVARTGHGQLIGTPITLALLGVRDQGHLAVPPRQRFTLGTLRLELIPSGRGFGAAALHVDIAGKTVLYAGAVRTTAGGTSDAGELRTSDAVVVAALYGETHHRFPPLVAAIDAALEWTRTMLATERRPVLVVDSVLDGLEVASRLAAAGLAVAGGRALREAAQRIADLVPGNAIPAIASPGREPRAVVWLEAERAGLSRALADRPAATALVSARALAGAGADEAAFVWAAAADRAQLLGWIEATGAREVFVTGPCAEAIVSALGGRARVIGPPHQMSLFPGEALT
jgi:putative mRNA 3-end processing factor